VSHSIRLALLSVVAAGVIALPAGADAASVVGPGGQISGCYVKKGKAKGTLRVVPPGRRCRRNERPLTFNAQGPSGQAGAQGGAGQVNTTALEDRITQLEGQVAQLESILAGITNTDLLNAITNSAKLNGITTQQLTDAIDSVAAVNSLCTEFPTVVGQLNSIRTVLTGLSLGGAIPLGLVLSVPSIPSALSAYACP
jgi:hypothetical protein